jgi:hypothetical protein
MESIVQLPTLHNGQAACFRRRSRFNRVRCGRRWGKDVLQNTIAGSAAARGKMAGLFAPEHKQLVEPFDALWELLLPIKKTSSRSEGRIRTRTGGGIDFWYLNDNELAGRGREYDVVLLNEVAFTKKNMKDTWRKAIRPTLVVRRGSAWALSTPKGVDPDNFFYAISHDEKNEYGFQEYYAPTSDNPLIPVEEIEELKRTEHPDVFKQEYLAQWVDWSGVAFFSLDKWLNDGMPLPFPDRCDTVFAVVDSAIKEGKEHDGTGVSYYATNQRFGQKLFLLDYDLIQIEGAMLETWLPLVMHRLVELAGICGARFPIAGIFIEDKGSGTILLQQFMNRTNMVPVRAIDSKLTAVGKDERAISVSSYHYNGDCKITQYCYDKLVTFKGITRNHMISQVVSFRIGDKDAHKRADDLLDTYTYALSISCGNSEGY